MEINLLEIWHHMGLPVRTVAVVLTLQAIGVVTVTVDRIVMLAMSRSRSRKFAQTAGKLGEAVSAARLWTLTKQHTNCHLPRFLEKGLGAYTELKQKGLSTARAIELTRLNLERRSESLNRELNRGMNVLASTGSTAPFVGLLGTVLGILHAFKMIASTGSGGIGTIGGAIGEALIVTGYGLSVAIPTVLLFNWLRQRLAAYEDEIIMSSGDMLERIEADASMEQGGENNVGADRSKAGAPARIARA